MILLLVLAGGLAANLTPCVLPLVPVNLSLVGKGAIRGAAYGLGITTAYGCLGLAAAFGGLAFGTIQSSPWFSLLAACVFVFLGLAVAEVFRIDFSRFRPRTRRSAPKDGTASAPSLLKPFALGAWSAVLAGACVEPILIATLVLTAEWFAAGRTWSVVLPFVLGAGMGLPWPFAAAGMKVLPRPGAWMRWVNRVFALMMFGMAAWYGWLAWNAWQARSEIGRQVASQDGRFEATPATWPQAFAAAKATGKPVFVDVWATWCKNCLAMEKTTFANPDVTKELANYAVVRLQAEDVAAFVALPEFKDLGIKGIPAFVVLDK
jgi:thiol:disulfide interchange protein